MSGTVWNIVDVLLELSVQIGTLVIDLLLVVKILIVQTLVNVLLVSIKSNVSLGAWGCTLESERGLGLDVLQILVNRSRDLVD